MGRPRSRVIGQCRVKGCDSDATTPTGDPRFCDLCYRQHLDKCAEYEAIKKRQARIDAGIPIPRDPDRPDRKDLYNAANVLRLPMSDKSGRIISKLFSGELTYDRYRRPKSPPRQDAIVAPSPPKRYNTQARQSQLRLGV